jgi:parallel beta-helix repeat protein
MHPWSSLPVQDINTGIGYETIQEAINANETLDGHRIFVKAGTYYENVIVTKAISLIGESEDSTIVDGMTIGSVIELSAHNVTITGFTIRNSGPGWAKSGIALNHFGNCNVSCNRIANNTYGMWLESSLDNTISRNDFANDGYGIGLYGSSNRNTILENNVTSSSHAAILLASSSDNDISKNNITDSEYSVELITSSNNTITENYVSNNSHGLALYESSNDNYAVGNTIRSNGWGLETDTSIDNKIYHNNFIDNTPQVYLYMSGYPNTWDADYPEGGNYWSDQNRTDFHNGPSENETGSDGIADSPYSIDSNNIDHYPLMGMFYDFEVYPPNLTGTIAAIELISNSSVSNLYYLAWINPSTQYLQHDQLFIIFSVEEENGTSGFCRLTIPRTVLNASTYTILVNWNPVNVAQLLMTNSTPVYLYFTFTGPKQEIIVTIPEFPLTMTLAVAIATTSASALLSKRRLKHRTESTI